MDTLTPEEARAVALRAQGFGRTWDKRDPVALLDHLGAIQLDSVNVVARSHDLVPFSRLGPHATQKIHRAIYQGGRGFEYWGHAASWLPMSDYRWFVPRMRRMQRDPRPWWGDVRSRHKDLYAGVLARVRDEGPIGAADFEDPRQRRGTWWDWKPAKLVLEDLFDQGQLMTAERTEGFARIYDLTERVLPPDADSSDPGEDAAARYLLLKAFRCLGIGTPQEAADYYRLKPDAWKPALRALCEARQLLSVRVDGWSGVHYAVPGALDDLSMPRHRPTFLSPFDNLIWERARTERLFDFNYRIEIYTPVEKRRFGYYVMPLLIRGQLAGRADFKLERDKACLRVHGLFIDRPVRAADVARALKDLARHLGGEQICVDRAQPRQWLAELRRLL
jgi:uncharacterized protein YcaQ